MLRQKNRILLGVFSLIFLLLQCSIFEDAPRDNPLDPKNPNLKVVRDGLEAWWKFDNGSLADEMGHHTTGFISSNAVRYVPDRFNPNRGSAIAADCNPSCSGYGALVNLSNSTVFNNFPLTIEFWLKLENFLPPSSETMLNLYLGGLGIYRISLNNSSQPPNLQIDNNTSSYATSVKDMNEWTHFVIMMNSLSDFSAYIFNKQDSIATEKVSLTNTNTGSVDTTTSGLTLKLTSGSFQPLYIIDDIRFYRKILTKTEAQVNHLAKD